MTKKTKSILIVFVIAAAAFIAFAAWAKITHRQYADDALTIGMFLQIGFIVAAIVFLFVKQKEEKQIFNFPLLTNFKIFLSLIAVLQCYFSSAQKIIGAVMLDEKEEITKNQNKAKYLVVLKKHNDTSYQRLDYNFAGPMQLNATYLDSTFTILNGLYSDYAKSGYLFTEGHYLKDKKEGCWYKYNDTAQAIKEFKYHSDTLLAVIDLDSLKKEKDKIKEDTTGQIEADFKGGIKLFSHYVYTNIQVPDRTASLITRGIVRVRFVVDEKGKVIEPSVAKSLEFAIDEECMRVISLSKDWIPASDKGKKVKAYRIQPIVVSIKD